MSVFGDYRRHAFVVIWLTVVALLIDVLFYVTRWAPGILSPEGEVRLRSVLPKQKLPAQVVGKWSVDVETLDGRLIGRARFTVTE